MFNAIAIVVLIPIARERRLTVAASRTEPGGAAARRVAAVLLKHPG